MTAIVRFERDRNPMPPAGGHFSNIYTTGTGIVDAATRYFPLPPAAVDYPHFRLDYPHTVESGVQLIVDCAGTIHAQRITSSLVIIQTEAPAYTGSSLLGFLKCMYTTGFSSVVAPRPSLMRSAAELRAERLSYIQSAFEFPIQTLAQVLRISRAQLYKWLDREKEIHLHENSRDRLIALEELASFWLSLSKTPLSSVAYEPLPGGGNITNLLSENDLNIVAVQVAMRTLADTAGVAPKSITQQMHERGFKRRPSARSFPSDA
jgi:Transposase